MQIDYTNAKQEQGLWFGMIFRREGEGILRGF
jgi:hypothetical protein